MEHRGKTQKERVTAALEFGEWRESFYANNTLSIEDKELIQTLGLSPSLPLVALGYRPGAYNSEQKRFTNILVLKKALTQI